ncbi:MAG: hypothetical protein DWI21_15800 [Planctomycetota bacterium]|nr:MAG: hypothetical protein DWI21_15800 [Planctomycetota bacterium]GDY08660.1 hypothetical protein LBMAG52_21460 [Planctomycetia bacterium]
MWIVFECPSCHVTGVSEVVAQTEQLRCSQCSWQRPVAEANRAASEPVNCVVCGCEDLWRQKDFPQRLGPVIVGIEVLVSTYFWWMMMPKSWLGVLLLFALVDGVLYTLLRDVLVCYRCGSRHRHTPLEGRHRYFNLETHERYRQEAIRLEEMGQKPENRNSKLEA